MRCKDGTLSKVALEKMGDKGREEECEFDAGRGGEEERVEEGDSVTLKTKQGNEYHGSLQDGC